MFAKSKKIARRLGYPLLGLPVLLALSCGGKEDGRPVGDSTKATDDTLSDCAVQASLEKVTPLPNGEFNSEAASGWGSTTDKTSNIRCPQDSQFDCCVDSQPTGFEVEDTEVNCADASAPLTSVFFGSTGTQPPPADWGVECKDAAPSGRALHVRAAHFTGWGAQIYYSFNPARDASDFDGISFWARLGKGGTQPVGQTLFVVVEDKFTKEQQAKYELATDPETGEVIMDELANGDLTPRFALDENENPKPVYTAYSGLTQAYNCYDVNVDTMKCDRFGAGVGLESDWRFIKIPFSSMRQRGYGVKSPAGRPLREELLGIGIYMDIGNWDFWIDQVAFYKEAVSSSE